MNSMMTYPIPSDDYDDIIEAFDDAFIDDAFIDDAFIDDVLDVAALEWTLEYPDGLDVSIIDVTTERAKRQDAMRYKTICMAYWAGFRAGYRRGAEGLPPILDE